MVCRKICTLRGACSQHVKLGFSGKPRRHRIVFAPKLGEKESLLGCFTAKSGGASRVFSGTPYRISRPTRQSVQLQRTFLYELNVKKSEKIAFSPLLGRVFREYPAVPGGAIGVIGAFRSSQRCTTIESTGGTTNGCPSLGVVLTAVAPTNTYKTFFVYFWRST